MQELELETIETDLPFGITFYSDSPFDSEGLEVQIVEYYEEELQSVIEEGDFLDADDFEFDEQTYEKEVQEKSCELIATFFKDVLKDENIFVGLVDWDKNGLTDGVYVDIEMSKETLYKCFDFIESTDLEHYRKWVKENVWRRNFDTEECKLTNEDLTHPTLYRKIYENEISRFYELLKEMFECVLEFYNEGAKYTQDDLINGVLDMQANGFDIRYKTSEKVNELCRKAGKEKLIYTEYEQI